MAASSSGFLVQGPHGVVGNFEVVAPRTGGGLVHYWRDNNQPGLPWHGPSLMFGSAGEMTAAALIPSNYGGPAGRLELVALEGSELVHYWRDDWGSYRWFRTVALPGPTQAVGSPGFVQSSHGGRGNFEVVAAVAGGGFAHWWRNNDLPGEPWIGPTPISGGSGQGVALIQSRQGKLEMVARVGGELVHYSRDDGATWAWQQQAVLPGGAIVGGDPALIQNRLGIVGNLEVVAPLAAGGFGHWFRDNDNPAQPWVGPLVFGAGLASAVGLVQSSFGPLGNLEIVARLAGQMVHYWRDDEAGGQWRGPTPFGLLPPSNPTAQGVCEIAFSSEIVGIHAALLHTGRVVIFGFSDLDDHVGVSRVLEPTTGQVDEPPESHNLFCSGHSFLSNGDLLVAGGHHHDLAGIHRFDATTEEWSHVGDMPNGRWYPTCTTLADGKVFVISGTKGDGGPVGPTSPVNHSVQIYDPAVGMGPEQAVPLPFSAFFPPSFSTIDLYPFVYLLPSGILLVHSRNTTRFYDPAAGVWGPTQLQAQYPFSRTYPGEAASVLLPLLPTTTPAYRARVAIFGGGGADPGNLDTNTPATSTVEILDLGEPAPAWRFSQPMAYPRVMPDAVLLPDGTVLVVGGSAAGWADHGLDPVLPIELFDPASETWTTLCSMAVPRLYHATALLLPDARVLMLGKDGIFNDTPYNYPEHRAEILSPPYLFRGPRPQITAAPPTMAYDSAVTVATPDAPDVAAAALLRPGAVTHSFNMEQRFVGLSILGEAPNQITLLAPPDPNVAPPGYYLLFLLNGLGVPSIATFVLLQ